MKKIYIYVLLVCLPYVVNAEVIQAIPPTGSLLTVTNPVPAKSQEYSFYYRGQTLKKALSMYAGGKGLTMSFSPELSSSVLNSEVNGRFGVTSDSQLLNTMADKFGFSWFIYSGKLYICSIRHITKNISVTPEDMLNIKETLLQAGLLNPAFGYSEIRSENKVVVSGPKEYVELVLDQINQLNVSPVSQQFAIYRLKYASATDTQVTFNNQQIVIPGVATILQNLLQNINMPGKNKISSQVSNPLINTLGANLASQIKTGESSEGAGSDGEVSNMPQIQADPRSNSVVVMDKKNNLPIYKQLISLLDIPTPLIQVEVLIIKINQDALNQDGIDWWSSFNNGKVQVGYGAGVGSAQTVASSFSEINPGQLVVTNMKNFSDALNFLVQKGVADTVGKPSLATTDSIPAVVNVTQSIYVNLPAEGGGTTNNATYTGNYTQANISTSLQITPHVIADEDKKRVKLSIVLQDGTLSNPYMNQMPNTSQSTLSSQAVINDGQSILLAGYTKDSKQETTSEVPYLGSIPVLGWFFKSKTTKDVKVTNLYLVTPKIIWYDQSKKLSDYIIVNGHQVSTDNNYYQLESPTARMPESGTLHAGKMIESR